jgi:hypothetical protein
MHINGDAIQSLNVACMAFDCDFFPADRVACALKCDGADLEAIKYG